MGTVRSIEYEILEYLSEPTRSKNRYFDGFNLIIHAAGDEVCKAEFPSVLPNEDMNKLKTGSIFYKRMCRLLNSRETNFKSEMYELMYTIRIRTGKYAGHKFEKIICLDSVNI